MRKIISVIVLVFCGNLFAGSVDALPVLRMGTSARVMGMGGAFAGLSDDVSASYYNPAGLSGLEKKQLSLMTGILSNDRSLNWFAFGLPFAKSAIGFSVLMSGVSDIPDVSGGTLTGGSFSSSDLVGYLTYSSRASENVRIGFNLKVLKSKIDDTSATGFGFDFGIKARASSRISIGFVIQDILTSLKWDTESKTRENPPSVVKMGLSCRLLENKLYALLDLSKISDRDDLKINGGLEYRILPVCLRAGWDDNNITAGFGLAIGALNFNYGLRFDNMEANENRHYISLDFAFGGRGSSPSYSYGSEKKEQKEILKAEKKRKKEEEKLEKQRLKEAKKARKEKEKKERAEKKKKAIMAKHYNKAVKFYQAGKYKKAIKEWEKVLELDPNHEMSLKNIEKAKAKLQE
ncbi:MAG: PorV/PorQ family protein [Elusimicrobia bacterium]|nr:PorV/PorQ family protein [Elusimicrobiota bacterium]